MKRFIIISMIKMLLLFATVNNLCAQIIYVKQNANGANDGTSWENAYTDLETALVAAGDSSEVWVAVGEYHPGGLSPNLTSVFAIHHSISIYGGFYGTEVNLEERDPSVNFTVLSGDINEDDIEGDFGTNTADNTNHVVFIESPTGRVVVDGFWIKGGRTVDSQNATIYERSGGGIHAISPVAINQCILTGNFGRAGGGIYLGGGASGSIVTRCTFSFNKTTSRGAGLFGLTVSDIQVANCHFLDNNAIRGSLSFITCMNIDINECVFEHNYNLSTNTGSAGVGSFDNINFTIRNSEFKNNSADAATAIIFTGTAIPPQTLSNILVDKCRFEGNLATRWGGAISFKSNPDIQILNSDFINNTASSGGAITIEQGSASWRDTSNVLIDRCRFTNNIANLFGGGALRFDSASLKVENSFFDGNISDEGGHIFQWCPGNEVIFRQDTFQNGISELWGGAATTYGNEAKYHFEYCLFDYNNAGRRGGAVNSNSAANSTFSHCQFTGNVCELSGGALALGADSNTLKVIDCDFIYNRAKSENGGAISGGNGSNHIIIDDSRFENNQTTQKGGAISIEETGDDNIASLQISNSRINTSVAADEGGAIYVTDADVEISSCDISLNLCNGDGRGAALFIRKYDEDTLHTSIVNSTFTGNEGVFSDGICLHERDSLPGELILNVQNCIFNNQGIEYATSSGIPLVISNGGNMSDDASMTGILTHMKDLNMTSPIYYELDFPERSLASNSPGVDDGVAGAPDFDILGNPRVNEPDMGAYENQFPVGIKRSNLFSGEEFSISPNPATGGSTEIVMNNSWIGPLEVRIVSLSGVELNVQNIIKTSESYRIKVPLDALSPAVYQVIVSNGEEMSLRKLIKI